MSFYNAKIFIDDKNAPLEAEKILSELLMQLEKQENKENKVPVLSPIPMMFLLIKWLY